MPITLHDLANDPALFLFGFDDDSAVFQTMTRDAFARSIFLDGRIKHGGLPSARVPVDALLRGWQPPPQAERRIGWIFHVAQCGSTLLARALDRPGRSLVLREPMALRRLGVLAGGDGGAADERLAALLRATLALLGKRWEADAPVIAKANVPVNFIAAEIMALDPAAPALLLHFPLDSYVAAVLRTEGHVRWAEAVFDELRLADSPYAGGQAPDSPATKVAALWFAQMKAFERIAAAFPMARSLDANRFFARPADTIAAAAALFGVPLDPGEAAAIAAGELFRSYSKNPALDYDPEVREAREAEAKQRLTAEIAAARGWAREAQARHGLPEALARPLLGEPAPLLG
ncbi:MAG TPA: hypothetical protein VEB68_14755 [Croceibacterium sp.]|nr:hypothetical protein [Croceibacterium sp.]